MFELKSKMEIGDYLTKMIKKEYGTPSDFCRAYLKVSGTNNDENEFQNLKNRVSSIMHGKKDIQLYDFPVFTKLLDVSCEEILSAGEVHTITDNHMSNYKIAISNDEMQWQAYIDRDAEAFLNQDEYKKTLVDYSVEFKNFELIKYLINNEYIRFVTKASELELGFRFGVETYIEGKPLVYRASYLEQLAEEDRLRRKVISLAIENSDIEMLEKLKAREIPPMYKLKPIGNISTDFQEYYDEDMIDALAKADESILDFFSEELTIISAFRKTPRTYMFPAIGLLLDKLITDNNKCTEAILRRCIDHNKNTYKTVKEIKERKYEQFGYEVNYCDLFFFEDGNIVSVYDSKKRDGTVTNIIKVNSKSDSLIISDLINEVNKYYNKILEMNPEKGG